MSSGSLLWYIRPGFRGFFFTFLLCTFLPALSRAQPSPVDTSQQEHASLAGSFANEKLWHWQKRLNLEDWKISVLVSSPSELKARTLGNIHWDVDKKTATIRVLDPASYQMPLQEALQDIEFTLVHELIHLELASVLSPFSRNDANRRDEEHAVNHIADALLKLDRGQ